MGDIREFRGEFRFMSNFWPAVVDFEGVTYPTVEHAYVTAKTLDEAIREDVLRCEKPGQAKAMGRQFELRRDWNFVKVDILENLVRQKFNHEDLKMKLLATGERYIMEGNNWGDKFWGVDLATHEGLNHMGKILMKIREELRG